MENSHKTRKERDGILSLTVTINNKEKTTEQYGPSGSR